jgi:chromosome segregation ATPase
MSQDDRPPNEAEEPNRDLESELGEVKAQLADAKRELEAVQQAAEKLRTERDELAEQRAQLEEQRREAIAACDAALADAQEARAHTTRVESALASEVEAHTATTASLAEERSARQLLEIERDDLREKVAELEQQLDGAQRARRAAETDASSQRSAKNLFIATTVAGAASHLLRKK